MELKMSKRALYLGILVYNSNFLMRDHLIKFVKNKNLKNQHFTINSVLKLWD